MVVMLCIFTCVGMCGCSSNKMEDRNSEDMMSESSSMIEQEVQIENYQAMTDENESVKVMVDNEKKLKEFLEHLTYTTDVNDGIPEYTITFDDALYYVNLSDGWVWKNAELEAILLEEELRELKSLLEL